MLNGEARERELKRKSSPEHRDTSIQASAAGIRQSFLHHLFLRETGALLPPTVPLTSFKRVLNALCGGGQWAIDLARAYPHIQVVGSCDRLISLRQAQADARIARLNNLRFDYISPEETLLPYTDEYFDCIHIQCDDDSIDDDTWHTTLREFLRVLRPGGWFHLDTFIMGTSSSPTLNRLLNYIESIPLPDNTHTRPPLRYPRLLAQAGFTHIRYTPHPLDLGNQNGEDGFTYVNAVLFNDRRIPYLFRDILKEHDEQKQFFAQIEKESILPGYCALGMLIRIVANAPATGGVLSNEAILS